MPAKKSVLVIDDEALLLEVMKTNLEIEGYGVLTANTGEKGLASAIVDHPDLIILDIMMPDIDGWEICRRLRLDPETKYIPVIMLTALDQPHHIVRGFEMGADDYLAKPFDNSELFARIKSVMSKAGKGMSIDPLTDLPGKHQVYEETRKRLEQRDKFFAFLYVDISNLRLVNYRYGVERGDSVIKIVADILRDIVMVDQGEFLGYMGEDDFVVLSVPLRVEQLFNALTTRFDDEIEHVCPDLAGGKSAGEPEIKLAIAVVTNETKQFGDPLQLKNIALEVLKNARGKPGHHYADLKDYPL